MKRVIVKVGRKKYAINPIRLTCFLLCLTLLITGTHSIFADPKGAVNAETKVEVYAEKTPQAEVQDKDKESAEVKTAKLVKKKLAASLVEPEKEKVQKKEGGVQMPIYAEKSEVKRYMDRCTVTDTSTYNYKICNVLSEAQSDGTLRVNGRIVVAMGQSYGKAGDCFDITLSSGKTIPVVIGDSKKYADTCDGAGWSAPDGSLLEFVVNTEMLDPLAKAMGDMNYDSSYEGTITNIIKTGSL